MDEQRQIMLTEKVAQMIDYHYHDLFVTSSRPMQNELKKLIFRIHWDSDKRDRYGEYYGVPMPKMTHYDSGVLPAEVVIFVRPLVQQYRNDQELSAKVRKVLVHEIGHHLGLSEDDLREKGIY